MTNISLITEYTPEGITYTDELGVIIGRTVQRKDAEGFNSYVFEELVKTGLIGRKAVGLLCVGEWLALACKEEFDAQLKAEDNLHDYRCRVVTTLIAFGRSVRLRTEEIILIRESLRHCVPASELALQIMSDRDGDPNRDDAGNWTGPVANENGWTP